MHKYTKKLEVINRIHPRPSHYIVSDADGDGPRIAEVPSEGDTVLAVCYTLSGAETALQRQLSLMD